MKKSKLEQQYLATDDIDEHMEIFSQIFDELSEADFHFLMQLLEDHETLDEFVVIEILKAFEIYIPKHHQSQAVKMLFKILRENEDELVQVYAVMGMSFMPIADEQKAELKQILVASKDINLNASISDVLERAK